MCRQGRPEMTIWRRRIYVESWWLISEEMRSSKHLSRRATRAVVAASRNSIATHNDDDYDDDDDAWSKKLDITVDDDCDRTGRRRDKCPSDARRKSRVQKLGEGPDSLLVPRRKLGRNYNAKRRVTFAVGNVAFWSLPARQVSSWSVQPFGHSARTIQTDKTGDRQENCLVA